jgi:hypothetical protein
MQVSEPLFEAYESAVDSFLRAGGHTASVIRSPRGLLQDYIALFPGSSKYALSVRIEEAKQGFVSVRGTNVAGQEFEWPDPE